MNIIKNKGFTLAEVLLALAIIGVVAALTYPTLNTNIREYVMKIKSRAFYNRVSQTIPLMANKFSHFSSALDFVDNEYRELFKMRMVCGTATMPLTACELPSEIHKQNGEIVPLPTKWSELNPKITSLNYTDTTTGESYSYSQEDSNAAAFITDNGESVIAFLNPKCKSFDDTINRDFYSAEFACLNLIYDVNGGQMPPNTIGKDIGFITVFQSVDSAVIAPFIDEENSDSASFTSANDICQIKKGNLRVPTEYELASIFINGRLTNIFDDNPTGFWSNVTATPEKAWALISQTGLIQKNDKSLVFNVHCVKR